MGRWAAARLSVDVFGVCATPAVRWFACRCLAHQSYRGGLAVGCDADLASVGEPEQGSRLVCGVVILIVPDRAVAICRPERNGHLRSRPSLPINLGWNALCFGLGVL